MLAPSKATFEVDGDGVFDRRRKVHRCTALVRDRIEGSSRFMKCLQVDRRQVERSGCWTLEWTLMDREGVVDDWVCGVVQCKPY